MPIPANSEREIIISILTAIENKLKKESFLLSKYKELKTGLMQDLLTGKVRVNIPATPTAA